MERWVRGVDVMDTASPSALTATAVRPRPRNSTGVPVNFGCKRRGQYKRDRVLNHRNDRGIKRHETQNSTDISSKINREKTLEMIGSTLSRIEDVLAGLEAENSSKTDSGFAYRRFMNHLRVPLSRNGNKIQVKENASFMQIRSLVNGHRIYISKGKVVVGRVDSTIPLGYVNGSVPPRNKNGNIRSWIPADVESVSKAIDLLGMEKLPPIE